MEMNNITLKNYTFKNLVGTGSTAEYFIYLVLNQGGSASIDGFTFVDSNLGFQTGFYIQDNVNSLVIQN